MNPLLIKAARFIGPYFAVMVAVGLVLFMAYRHGISTTTDRYEAILAQRDRDHALATYEMVQRARRNEQAAAESMAAIDRAHQEQLRNEIDSRDRAIADLRAGTIQLRSRFTCPAADPGVRDAGASTSSSDAASAGGLQPADAEFLVRLASRADQVARQLQACQAVVRADRAGAMGVPQ